MNTMNDAEKVVRLVQEAGGRVVGRTRLQKIVCLLELADVEDGFRFSYHLFGPYSEELSNAIERAVLFDKIHEKNEKAGWGGTYSIYTTKESAVADSPIRKGIIEVANSAGAIALELAATAAYLAKTKVDNPWYEVVQRKPEKEGKIDEAKELYARLCAVAPDLPAIA